MVDADFDIKEKVQKLLTEGGYDKMRARTMDMDDFLGWVQWRDLWDINNKLDIIAFAERHPKLVARKNRDFSGRTSK